MTALTTSSSSSSVGAVVPTTALEPLASALILASTSRYRRELMERLTLRFDTHAPNVDETPLPDERPVDLARRLALAKAQTVAEQYPDAWVIGSDQVADLNGISLGKPGTHDRAVQQLRRMSGHRVVFQTAVAVVQQAHAFAAVEVIPVEVVFRTLSDVEIETYLRLDQPYDCAGSARSEGLGVTLLERMTSDDPTALIGLPLIATCHLLRQAGLDVLKLKAAACLL